MLFDELFLPRRPATPKVAILRRCVALLHELDQLLPALDLPAEEHQALAGHLALPGPVLVSLTAHRVAGHEELFADYPASDPGDLRERQHQAYLTMLLRNWLQDLTERAADHHVRTQSSVLSEVLDLLRLVRYEAYNPRAPEPARRRALILGPVSLILDMIRAKRNQARAKKARQKKAQQEQG